MLPESSGATDSTLFPVYQPGAADLAQKVTAKQIRKYVENTSTLAEDIRRLSEEIASMKDNYGVVVSGEELKFALDSTASVADEILYM